MSGKALRGPLPALSESVMGGYQSSPEQERVLLRSIRADGWKLLCKDSEAEDGCALFDLETDPGETADRSYSAKEKALELRKALTAQVAEMQARRVTLLADNESRHSQRAVPQDAVLERPRILSPAPEGQVRLDQEKRRLVLSWTGDPALTYVVEYDVGRGWRNLKGSFPVQGTRKVFGPLPREAWEPLPYWNPFRVRVSPYGLEGYWSEWVTFSVVKEGEG